MILRLVWTGLLFAFLSIPALWSEPGHSPVKLFHAWVDAMGSGTDLLSLEQVRGEKNPGLPALTLRLLNAPLRSSVDGLCALIYGGVFWLLWRKLSQKSAPLVVWVGALALTPMIHPLPWWHLSAFSFPFVVFGMSQVFEKNMTPAYGVRNAARCFMILGLFLITVSTQKVLGAFGKFLELHAAKSFGVLSCLVAFYFSELGALKRPT